MNLDNASGTDSAWHGGYNALVDPEERRVLFATLDSFR
jgi:hypothetical protein